MFAKFDKTQIGNSTAIKSSVQRAIRQKLLDQFESLRENDGALLEQIWPKKESISLIKCHNQLQLLSFNGFPLFFQSHDDPYVPTLRLLHLYPHLLPPVTVDRGAIRFLIAGANVMSPGLTSKGGKLPPTERSYPANTVVAIFAEGKDHPVAIGICKTSTEEIKKVNKGIGIDTLHFIGDGLYKFERI